MRTRIFSIRCTCGRRGPRRKYRGTGADPVAFGSGRSRCRADIRAFRDGNFRRTNSATPCSPERLLEPGQPAIERRLGNGAPAGRPGVPVIMRRRPAQGAQALEHAPVAVPGGFGVADAGHPRIAVHGQCRPVYRRRGATVVFFEAGAAAAEAHEERDCDRRPIGYDGRHRGQCGGRYHEFTLVLVLILAMSNPGRSSGIARLPGSGLAEPSFLHHA